METSSDERLYWEELTQVPVHVSSTYRRKAQLKVSRYCYFSLVYIIYGKHQCGWKIFLRQIRV